MPIAMPAIDTQPRIALGTPNPAPAPPLRESLAPNGRLQVDGVPDFERNFAIAMHLSLFATILVIPPFGCIVPVILWLIRREKSPFVDDHGRELANVVITGAIFTLALGFIPILGWIALLVWYIVIAVGAVRGAIGAGRGEYFRYPMTFRFLS